MKFVVSAALLLFLLQSPLLANIPGGGTGTGANVTLTDNGSTVTIANGIVSLLCNKSGASISQINYTYNNNGTTRTTQLLNGGTDGGELYWEDSSDEGLTFTYTLVSNPANNGGNYAEIALYTTSVTGNELEVHFSLLRGSTGFYVTAIYSHMSSDGAFGMGECRDNIYAGSIFNWMSVDANRNRLMEVSGGSAIAVQGAPKEVSLWTNGIYAGQYEDKYKYSADLGTQRVWGWSSVGTGGLNVGLWNIIASSEYYNGGPLKRELMEHIGTTVLNMLNGGHYGMGSDGNFASGEVWDKVYGPYFIYCNSVTNTLTGTNQPAAALYADAQAQAQAEVSAWPYTWFTNANFTPASNRGDVTGQFAINDTGNPNASAAGLWVGMVEQPSTTDGVYDFQQWMKPYQFWTKTDTNGNFTLTNIIAGGNYTLYAFGPGSCDTYMSQSQSGGNPPLITDVPSSQFAVTVTAGATNNLGTVTWTPARVGATVFEIGYPDRAADKFRHGDDYWVGDIGPSPAAPSPIWSKWLQFPLDYPNGLNYIVGQNRWTTDWNFIQPVVTDTQGNYDSSSSTITFNLASAPANSAQASLYLGLASDYSAAMIVTVNGSNLGSVGGVTGTPNNSIPSTGYYAGYQDSDSNIREGNNAAFSDERLNFPVSLLKAGANTINIGFREVGAPAGGYFADHAMYDYIRLELTGYVPPAPVSVTTYSGNNCNLVCWPATPGATSYNILRSTTSGNGYVSLTNGVTGPVCGSGTNNAVYLDTTADNGTNYYYEVQSVNPTGTSASSTQSLVATPSAGISISAPATPTGLNVSSSGHMSVTLSWGASSGANYYSVWRSTLENTGGGTSNTLSTIILNNSTTNTTFTDNTPTDGAIYRYFVTATSAGGTSGSSTPVVAVALPAPPASLPVSLTGSFTSTTNITLNWNAVPGAVGYAIYRATSSSGPYTYLQTVTELTYTDVGLSPSTIYYYHVAAVNDAGTSANASDSVNSAQVFPSSLTAIGTNTAVILSWPATSGATSYIVKRGTSSGNETVTVVSAYTGTTYTNSGLVNGTTYYYVVNANGSGGISGNSPEASATPYTNGVSIWISPASGNWSATTNWNAGLVASGPNSTADFSTLNLPTNLMVTLDSVRTVGIMKFGAGASSYNWTVAGSNTLTLSGTSPGADVLNQSATLGTVLAGNSGLTKNGPGVLTLNASNTFTAGVVLNAGTVTLDFTAIAAPVTNIIPAVNALTNAGGLLQVIGNGSLSSTQTFASTTLTAGNSVFTASNNVPTLNLGTITAKAGATVDFFGPPTVGSGGGNVASNAVITTPLSGNNAFVGPEGGPYSDAFYATVGLYDFAATTGPASPYTVVGGSQISGFYTTASGTGPTSGNVDVTGNITGWAGQPYLGCMRFNTSIGANISVDPYSTLTLPDILETPNVGAYNVTYVNNNLRPGSDGTYGVPFLVWQNDVSGELIINSGIGNSKSGTSFYVQNGPGTVVLGNTGNGYSAQSYLNGGFSLIAADGALGSAATGAAVNLNGGAIVANGTFALDNGGANLRPLNLLGAGGSLAATAGNTFTVDGLISGASYTGPLTIGIAASSANNNTAGRLPGTGSGTANSAAVLATGTVVLTNANQYTGGTVIQSGTLNINGINALGGANYGGLTINGGVLQYAAGFTGNNGSADLTSIGSAGLTLASGGGTIDLNGNSVTYIGSIGNNGSGALMVKSTLASGILNLNGANTYTGATTITNASFIANNITGSATGSGDVTVQNGGILGGDGSVGGSVTINSGGTLMPGVNFASLGIANNLTLASGSTTWMQIQHGPTNNSVNLSGAFTEGGMLVVTNVGTAALTNGDIFPLFNAASYSGTFSSIVLPPLTSGLFWNTNALLQTGILSVVQLTSPTISETQLSNGTLTLGGSGAPADWPYYVLTSTDITLPLSQWTCIATNYTDNYGNFTATNAVDPSLPQSYIILQFP